MKNGNGILGAPYTLRRLVASVIFVLLLVLLYRCSAQNAAELQQYGNPRHHHVTVNQ